MRRRFAPRRAAESGTPGAGRSWFGHLRAVASRLSLTQRFALACLVILVTGGVVIGRWVSGEIESGVREIASRLGLSEKTEKSHVTGVMRKLGVRNRVEAALIAARQKRPGGAAR